MFDQYAVLFDACAQHGLADPNAVRRLEMRDVAAILGVNRPPLETEGRDGLSFNQRRAAQLENDRPAWMNEPLPGEVPGG